MVKYKGIIHEHEELLFSSQNRGLQYADAVFETIRVSNGKLFFWEDHYFRLMATMRMLRMEIPMNFTMEFLEEEIFSLLKSASEKNTSFRVKILAWRNASGKYTPSSNEVDYCIVSESLENDFYTLSEKAYEVELFKDHYIYSGMLSTLKTTTKTIQVLASIFASENRYQNCLLLNEKKQVVEAANGNLFLVKGNTIKTPPMEDGCLKGIIRKQIITIAKQSPEFTIEEASISPFDLQKADELFITNVITGIQPISKYRKKNYTSKVAKNLLSKLNMLARKEA